MLLPFDATAYLQLFGLYVMPNVLLASCLAFTVVALTRNIYAGFIAVVLLLLLRTVSGVFIAKTGSDTLVALLDPMAYVVAQGIDELDAITEIRQRADLAASIIGFNNTPVGIEPASESSINSFQLRQNYPNPFNPSTAIEFTIRRNAFVELTIYNSLGQQLQILQKGSLPSGSYRIPFSAEGLEAGIYFYRLKVDGQSRVRKMIYMP